MILQHLAVWALACLLWPAFLGFNLDLGYYAHLVAGQARLLLNRQPIDGLLKDPHLDPHVRERLTFIQDVRQFALDRIGLARSRSYTSYSDTGDGPLSWQLMVAPRDRLEPVTFGYPVVGRFPYKGFFSLERARGERDRWKAKGYDTCLRPVSAYSTLGWFDDPVITSMLDYRDGDLADLVIHEMTHATVWIEGDVPFNESLATFVGQTGSMDYLIDRLGAASPEVFQARNLRDDRQTFRAFMAGVAQELEVVYSAPIGETEKLTRRKAVFDSARAQFRRLPLRTRVYGDFDRWELNNARMLAYRTYHAGIDVFDRVYAAVGQDLKQAVDVFRACEGRRRPSDYLEGWLASHGAKRAGP